MIPRAKTDVLKAVILGAIPNTTGFLKHPCEYSQTNPRKIQTTQYFPFTIIFKASNLDDNWFKLASSLIKAGSIFLSTYLPIHLYTYL